MNSSSSTTRNIGQAPKTLFHSCIDRPTKPTMAGMVVPLANLVRIWRYGVWLQLQPFGPVFNSFSTSAPGPVDPEYGVRREDLDGMNGMKNSSCRAKENNLEIVEIVLHLIQVV